MADMKVVTSTPNETESSILVGIDTDNEKNIKKAAGQLLKKVNEAVLITLGEKGIYFISKNEEESMIAAKVVSAIDTTAAGDVFNGYFAVAISEGKSYNEAIIEANKAAAISVTRKGAQPSIPMMNELIESS